MQEGGGKKQASSVKSGAKVEAAPCEQFVLLS